MNGWAWALLPLLLFPVALRLFVLVTLLCGLIPREKWKPGSSLALTCDVLVFFIALKALNVL